MKVKFVCICLLSLCEISVQISVQCLSTDFMKMKNQGLFDPFDLSYLGRDIFNRSFLIRCVAIFSCSILLDFLSSVFSMVVSAVEGQLEFPLQLLNLQPIAPEDPVLFVNVRDICHQGLEVLDSGIDGLSGTISIVVVIHSPDGILHVIDAHPGVDEEVLKLVQPNLDLFWVQGFGRGSKGSKSKYLDVLVAIG